jgi:hypothetical protein
VRKLCLEN